MSPRERILAAMRREDVDYLPCSIYFNSNLQVPGYDLASAKGRFALQLDLGVDPVASVSVPERFHPDVKTRTWLEDVDSQSVLFKEFETPAGTLRMGVRYTDAWPSGMDIPFGDHSAGHMFEPLIKSPDDVDAFEYIVRTPTDADLESARDRIETGLEFARSIDLPIQGFASHGLAAIIFAMGAENTVMFAVDYPEAFARLAQIESRAALERIRLSARAGADFVKRFGGYEQTNFFNPAIFREVVLPLLRQEVAAAHDAGIMIYYRVVTGMEPLLDDIASVGFDCIEGGEPHLGNCSLEMWRDAFSGKACSWTGVSTPALLGGSDPEAVRREVRHCAEVFGKRGYILGVTNSIRNHFPWQNTLAMIDEWKKVR